MFIYALIAEVFSDDSRLLGVYSSVESARSAYESWEERSLFPFYRIERRPLDGSAEEYDPAIVVHEQHTVEDEEIF